MYKLGISHEGSFKNLWNIYKQVVKKLYTNIDQNMDLFWTSVKQVLSNSWTINEQSLRFKGPKFWVIPKLLEQAIVFTVCRRQAVD